MNRSAVEGYALEACRAIVKYGFETLELDKIRLCTKRSNTASRILAEKWDSFRYLHPARILLYFVCKKDIIACIQNNEKIQSSV